MSCALVPGAMVVSKLQMHGFDHRLASGPKHQGGAKSFHVTVKGRLKSHDSLDSFEPGRTSVPT